MIKRRNRKVARRAKTIVLAYIWDLATTCTDPDMADAYAVIHDQLTRLWLMQP